MVTPHGPLQKGMRRFYFVMGKERENGKRQETCRSDHIHGCDRFYKFLVVCHFLFPFPLQNKNAAFPSVRGHAALPPCCILIIPLSPVLRYTFMQDSKAGSKASDAGISQPIDSLSGHFHFVLFLINVTFAISLCQS